MAEVTFGISHLMSLADISAFPLNHPTARNAMPLGLLSPRAGAAASPRPISAARAVLPNDFHLVILMTLLPAPPAPTPARVRVDQPIAEPKAPPVASARSPRRTRSGCARRPSSCLSASPAPAPAR